jgi:DNA repair exonuclease SbcCD ATPase subunit
MSTLNTPEHGPSISSSAESRQLIVEQPKQLAELNNLLSTLDDVSSRMSEKGSEDRSGDWSGGGSTAANQSSTQEPSEREVAIAAISADPAVLQLQLKQHIEEEIKELSKVAKRIAKLNRPGAAYRANQMYARIRRLNSLIASIFETSYDTLKRLFIRVFIDKQPVL